MAINDLQDLRLFFPKAHISDLTQSYIEEYCNIYNIYYKSFNFRLVKSKKEGSYEITGWNLNIPLCHLKNISYQNVILELSQYIPMEINQQTRLFDYGK